MRAKARREICASRFLPLLQRNLVARRAIWKPRADAFHTPTILARAFHSTRPSPPLLNFTAHSSRKVHTRLPKRRVEENSRVRALGRRRPTATARKSRKLRSTRKRARCAWIKLWRLTIAEER